MFGVAKPGVNGYPAEAATSKTLLSLGTRVPTLWKYTPLNVFFILVFSGISLDVADKASLQIP